MDDVSLRRLRYFTVLSETLHFGRAADLLHISQPALSTEIRKLESELRVPLFVRTPSTALTREGEVLLHHARALLTAASRFAAHSRALSRGSSVQIVVSSVATLLHRGLPQVVSTLKRTAPHVSVSIRELSSSASLEGLRRGEIDIALTYMAPDTPDVHGERVRTDGFLIALPPSHHGGGHESAPDALEELAGAPFVTFRRDASPHYHDRVVEILRGLGVEPDILHEASTWDGVIRLVARGMGAAVVPEVLRDHPEGRGLIRHVELPTVSERAETWISRSAEGSTAIVEHVYTEIRDRLRLHDPEPGHD